jgi:hypothetical protein
MYCKGSGEKGPYIQGCPENEGGVPSISSSSVGWVATIKRFFLQQKGHWLVRGKNSTDNDNSTTVPTDDEREELICGRPRIPATKAKQQAWRRESSRLVGILASGSKSK